MNFPKDWKETELHNLFSSISKLLHPIIWVDDTSAYVSIKDKHKHDEVINKHVLNNQHSDTFQVIPFPEPSKIIPKTNKRKHSNSEPEDGEISGAEEEEEEEEQRKPPLAKKPTFDVNTEW